MILRGKTPCTLAALLFVSAAPGARASASDAPSAWPCPGSVSDWLPGRGELAPDRRCGSFLLTTDAEDHDESMGEVSWKAQVKLPYQAQVRWRRLGSEGGRPIWLKLLGGHLMFKSGAVGLWINRAQFAVHGYEKVKAFEAHDEHLIAVRQTLESVEVRIDGALAARFALRGPRGAGRVAIGFSGARGYRSLIAFRDFAVTGLPAQ